MKAGLWNIVFGLVAIAAGASGRFALPGTSSPWPLVAAGALLAAFGLGQFIRSNRQR
jgi:hypothetical protein